MICCQYLSLVSVCRFFDLVMSFFLFLVPHCRFSIFYLLRLIIQSDLTAVVCFQYLRVDKVLKEGFTDHIGSVCGLYGWLREPYSRLSGVCLFFSSDMSALQRLVDEAPTPQERLSVELSLLCCVYICSSNLRFFFYPPLV